MSGRFVLPFLPYETGAKSPEEIRIVHQRNRETIQGNRVKFASFRQRLAETSVRASKRSKNMIQRSIMANRKKSQQIYNLATIDHSIAAESKRDNIQRSAKRIEEQLTTARTQIKRRAMEVVSEEGVRGRFDKARKEIVQKSTRLEDDVSAARRNSIQITGREFERARTMILGEKENFRVDASKARTAIKTSGEVIDDSRSQLRVDRVSFEKDVKDAGEQLKRGGDKAGRLMSQHLLSGAKRFRDERNEASKRIKDKRGEVAKEKRLLEESASAASRRFKHKVEEAKLKSSALESEKDTTTGKHQYKARGKKLEKEFQESIETSRDLFIAGVAEKKADFEGSGRKLRTAFRDSSEKARSSFARAATEKKAMIMRQSSDVMKQGQIRRDQMKKKLVEGKVLFQLDVRIAQHRLAEISKRLQTGGNRTTERLADRRERVLRSARAKRKAKLIRNALSLIRSMS